jgi:hypothetical protein
MKRAIEARSARICRRIRWKMVLLTLAVLVSGFTWHPQGHGWGAVKIRPPKGNPTVQTAGGVLHGGRKPINGSTVTLWAVGTTGYGSAPTSINSTTSDSRGNWSMTVSCPTPDTQVYVTATNGDAGDGSNTFVGLMLVLGPCGSLPDFVAITEVTTVASVWAMAQFMDSTGRNIGASAGNATGLKNAAAIVNNLTNVATGQAAAFMSSGANSPDTLNTLANILAACINQPNSSVTCAHLMCDATPGLTYNTSNDTCSGTPTASDTLAAAHLIATNPSNNVAALFAIAKNTPFKPNLSTAPDGWEIGVNYAPSGASFSGPNALALDASGNVFVSNYTGSIGSTGSVSELTASSAYTSGSKFVPSAAAFNQPQALALDSTGNVWIANCGFPCSGSGNNGSVGELTAGSSYSTGLNFAAAGAAFDAPIGIALDSSGNVFVANFDGVSGGAVGSVSELTAGSSYATGLNFNPSGAALDAPDSIALDTSSNVWVANVSSLSELTNSSSYGTGANFAPAGAVFSGPGSVTLDASNNVWAANFTNATVSELTSASSYATGLNFAAAGGAFNEPDSVALDGSGNAWVANAGTTGSSFGTISELTAASSYATGLNFSASGAAFGAPYSVAIDASGNVWAANNSSNSVSELLGLAKPVTTPIQSCLAFKIAHVGQACVP